MNLLGTWLTDRMDLQLHVYQLKILIRIVKVKPRWLPLFGLQNGVMVGVWDPGPGTWVGTALATMCLKSVSFIKFEQ